MHSNTYKLLQKQLTMITDGHGLMILSNSHSPMHSRDTIASKILLLFGHPS